MSFLQTAVSEKSSIQVAVRVRPINERESDSNVITAIQDSTIYIRNPEDRKKKTFAFDYAYDVETAQETIYDDIGLKVVSNAFSGYNTCVFAYGLTGCFAKNTPIMMFNGSYKNVQDIKLGDVLMGDDSTPRNVIQLFRGVQDMYTIKPRLGGFDEYTVNEDHIMVFDVDTHVNIRWRAACSHWFVNWFEAESGVMRKQSFRPESLNKEDIDVAYDKASEFANSIERKSTIVEIPLKEYLKFSTGKKKYYSCYASGVDFPDKKVLMDPYFLGLWLGDGTSSRPQITSIDKEIINYVDATAESYDCYISINGIAYTIANKNYQKEGNPVVDYLRYYNLLNNKHIPNAYKRNSREVRLQLLAGFIDTDGYYDPDKNVFEIIQKNKRLADDLLYLIRSLGMYASLKECRKGCMYKGEMRTGTYYRCYFTGPKLSEIPTLLSRKTADDNPNRFKRYNTFPPDVKYQGVGNYYGFMLDGNHRFIGAGFNVLRNSGKSHTIMGDTQNPGLIPRVCQALFDKQIDHNGIDIKNAMINYKIEVSYLEIYSEEVRDLLTRSNPQGGLKVRQHPEFGPYVEGLSQILVEDYKSIKKLIDQGNKERATASTLMNARSSRSHAILTIYFTQLIDEPSIGKTREIVSKVNLVDLAGSERVEASGVTGINFKEAININKSLSTLGLVISKLAAYSSKVMQGKSDRNTPSLTRALSAGLNKKKKLPPKPTRSPQITTNNNISPKTSPTVHLHKKDGLSSDIVYKKDGLSPSPTQSKLLINEHVPFRDSVLTWILKESLGGNSKTYMIATVSPSDLHYNESLSTLRYAYNAKQIINTVKVNEDPNDKLIRVLRNEIDTLRSQLLIKGSDGTTNSIELKQLREELLQREELMKEKDKSWEQKLEESTRLKKQVEETYKHEITQKQAEWSKKMELMNSERTAMMQEMDLMKSAMGDTQLQQQKVLEDELAKKQTEFENKQRDFEKGRIVDTAVSLQEYYEKKLESLRQQYEDKIKTQAIEDINHLKDANNRLKDDLNKNQRDLQIQMRQFTNDRAVLSRQIQQLHSKIHALEKTTDPNDEYMLIKEKRDDEEKKYQLLTAECSALNTRIETNKKTLSELETKFVSVSSELALSKDELDKIKREYKELSVKFETDKDEYNELITKKEILHTEIFTLKATLDEQVSIAKQTLRNPTIEDLIRIKEGFNDIFIKLQSK